MPKVCLSCGLAFDAEEDWKKLCYPCWKKKNGASGTRREPPRPSVKVVYVPYRPPEDMLKILINLCHPDRHGGKDMATKATQYLLELRDS